jgi:hypothetical protein
MGQGDGERIRSEKTSLIPIQTLMRNSKTLDARRAGGIQEPALPVNPHTTM